jgi:magnesium-dependent phosphatase 1
MRLLSYLTMLVSFLESATGVFQHPTIPKSRRDFHQSVILRERALATSSSSNDDEARRLPALIIFDLDGCLWRPEMYELLYFSGGAGAPFTKSPDYEKDGTLLTRKGEPVRLLGQVREIMQELYCNPEKWKNTRVGISSRTDQPEWARELLQKFTINKNSTTAESFALEEIMQGPIEIRKDSKEQHFQRISSTTGVAMQDILFFDNERGNCREVSKLGVVVGYCPDGVTKQIWDVSLQAFPTAPGKVVGLDIYSYDSLEGANLFYDGDGYKKTDW